MLYVSHILQCLYAFNVSYMLLFNCDRYCMQVDDATRYEQAPYLKYADNSELYSILHMCVNNVNVNYQAVYVDIWCILWQAVYGDIQQGSIYWREVKNGAL